MLTSSYEGKFGTQFVLHHSATSPESTPRARQGLTKFTDASNPFDRKKAKQIVPIDAARADVKRAGARTRNPGIIQGARAQSADPQSRTVPLRYSTGCDYKPGKNAGPARPAINKESPVAHVEFSPAPFTSGSGRALTNYLNDMKSSCTARRMTKDWGPSPALQRMNDKKVKMVTEMRDESRERQPPERSYESGCVPLSPRSADEECAQLFARKRRASAVSMDSLARPNWQDYGSSAGLASCDGGTPRGTPRSWQVNCARRSQSVDILHHDEAYVTSARSERENTLKFVTKRVDKADARSDELAQHMRSTHADIKSNFEQFRARDRKGMGIFRAHHGDGSLLLA